MGNSGTNGADETRRDFDPDEPGGTRRPRRHAREDAEPTAADRPTDSAAADGRAGSDEPSGPDDHEAAGPWGEGYSSDVAPEWPLTNENRVVETAAPSPAAPANPPATRSSRADTGRDETYPAAGPERPRRDVDDARRSPGPERPADVRPGRDETVPAADDTTVLPVTSRPPLPGETTVLPAIGAAESAGPYRSAGPRHASPDEAETSLLPGLGTDAAHHTGHARITGEAERPRGFLVAQGLSAMGSDGPIFTSVSVAAERGEVVAIVGDAGTGRTALLLALAGRFKYQAGSLAVDGDIRPARIRASVAIAWAPPAVVFEDDHTIAAVLTESALVGDVAEAEVRRCCEELRLDLDTGAAFGQLSRIDKTLLALASAWASGAPAVAVDDLDSGVDDAGSVRLWEAVRRIADDWRLVLVTAVRAGAASDRSVHPRPLALTASVRRGDTEPLR